MRGFASVGPGVVLVEGRKLAGGVEMVIATLAVNKRKLTDRSSIYFSSKTGGSFCSRGCRLQLCPRSPSVLVRIASRCKVADADADIRITLSKERKGLMQALFVFFFWGGGVECRAFQELSAHFPYVSLTKSGLTLAIRKPR